MLALIALTLVCVLTYSIEITFGLAGTILMLMVMSLVFETKTLVIYSVLPQILVAVIGLVRSPRTVDPGYLARMLAFASLGAFAGLYLFYAFSTSLFQVLLASAVTAFGLYLVAAPVRMTIGPSLARVLDTLAGASQALFGISGPIAMTRLLGTFEQKVVVRNYALAFFLCLNLFRAGGYLIHGTITKEIWQMMAFSAPFLAAALWFANHLHFRVNEAVFRRVVAWLVLGGGVSLYFH